MRVCSEKSVRISENVKPEAIQRLTAEYEL